MPVIASLSKHSWIWVLLTLFLLPLHQLYNVSLLILNIAGLTLLVKHGRPLLKEPANMAYLLLFLCFWIPMLLSLPDATHPRSLKTTMEFLRFPLAGMAIIHLLKDSAQMQKLWKGIAILCLFWACDGLAQATFGVNLFGSPLRPGAIEGTYFVTGVFYPHFTLGHVIAILTPICLEAVRRFLPQAGIYRILLVLPLFFAVLLSGRRAAWIMLAVSMSGYGIYLWRYHYRQRSMKYFKGLGLALVLLTGGAASLYYSNENFALRIQESIPDSRDLESSLARSTALRTWIWESAGNMFTDNWINGVGPRGFRYVYRKYSQPDDPFYESGQTHAHMTMLEIATETGVIGLAGYFFFIGLMFYYSPLKRENRHPLAIPLLIACLTLIFPLNTAKAIYGSFFATLFWWLTAVYLAASHAVQGETGESR